MINSDENMDKVDDLMLASFVDGQLDAANSRAIIATMDNNPELRERVYKLRKIKDLVKLGFEDAKPSTDTQYTPEPVPFWRQYCSMIAASITAIAITASLGFGAGITYYNQRLEPFSSQGIASINLEQPDRIILHISESDPMQFESSLAFVEEFLKKNNSDNARIEVVANAGGIDLMRADYPLGEKVLEMMATYDNVTFVACTNAINKLRRQGVETIIIKDVKTNEAVMDHILDRVRSGWTYIKASEVQKMMAEKMVI